MIAIVIIITNERTYGRGLQVELGVAGVHQVVDHGPEDVREILHERRRIEVRHAVEAVDRSHTNRWRVAAPVVLGEREVLEPQILRCECE